MVQPRSQQGLNSSVGDINSSDRRFCHPQLSLTRYARSPELAEEEGFEPPVESPLRRFSKPLPSTTRPLLRRV